MGVHTGGKDLLYLLHREVKQASSLRRLELLSDAGALSLSLIDVLLSVL